MTSASLIYGGKGKNRVVAESNGKVTIRVPLPALCYFDYQSFLITNDVPMVLGLTIHTNFRTITNKTPRILLGC